MVAALRLSWYKFKHSYVDFLKVLIGILIFEGLILYIQDKGFLKDFETSRMTLFLLLFSSSLLILVQNSIYISKERAILDRDFFSQLSRLAYAGASLVFHLLFTLVETFVFLIGFHFFVVLFEKDLPSKGQLVGDYWLELGVTIFLIFLCSHYLSLVITAIVGKSEITSVILAVILGIVQFSLSGTILQLPDSLGAVSTFIFLGKGHRLFGMTSKIATLPSVMANYHIPVPSDQLDKFHATNGNISGGWLELVLHAFVYATVFIIILNYKRSKV